jgi:hypothetical protein
MEFKKLWIALALVLIISFPVLGGVGYKTDPPQGADAPSWFGR